MDGVTNQAPKHLNIAVLPHLLADFNATRHYGEAPIAWKSSIVHPLHKPGKPADATLPSRLISLTSSMCKLMKRFVHLRLFWLLEENGAIPEQLSDFRWYRTMALSIRGLASSLEEA